MGDSRDSTDLSVAKNSIIDRFKPKSKPLTPEELAQWKKWKAEKDDILQKERDANHADSVTRERQRILSMETEEEAEPKSNIDPLLQRIEQHNKSLESTDDYLTDTGKENGEEIPESFMTDSDTNKRNPVALQRELTRQRYLAAKRLKLKKK